MHKAVALQGLMSIGGGARPLPAGLLLRRLRVGLLALNALVVVIVALLLWRLWVAELQDAQSQASASASQLAQGASATFEKVALSLDHAAAAAQAQGPPGTLDAAAVLRVRDAVLGRVPELQRMGVFDAAGHRLCSAADPGCVPYDIGDRDYFAALRAHPEQPALIVGPLQTRPDREWSLLMVRAVSQPGRPFAGVLVAVLPVSRLQPLVAAAKVGPQGAAGLRTATLDSLVRAGDAPLLKVARAEQQVSEQLRQQVAAAPEAGAYRAVSAADQVDRVAAYRKLPGYPVYALVGLALDDVLASWRLTAAWSAGFVLLFMAASAAIERLSRSALARQEAAQALYDEAPCGYHTLDAQGRYLSINSTELQWLGCTRAELIGKLGPTDFYGDEGRAVFARNFPVLQLTGRVDGLEFDLTGRHGRTRRVTLTASAVFDADGRFLMSNTVMHDITALHAARAELAALVAEQRTMLDTEQVGMLRVLKGRVTWANRGMTQLLGYGPEEWVGMPIAQIFHDEVSYQSVAQAIGALVHGAGHFRRDVHGRHKDGSSVWLDSSAVRISADHAESFTIATDITARKQAEAARAQALALQAENLALVEAARLKDEFLANLSHELRTPLNAVIGFAQLLQSKAVPTDSPKHGQYLRQIGDSGQHLLGLVQTMLDFAKVTSGKLPLRPVHVNVQQALDEVPAMLQPQAAAAGVGWVVAVEPGLDTVLIDPLRLRQMLLNLADNAIKFSGPGTVVRLRAWATDAAHWCVEVQDQGIGIAPEDLDRLFQPFVQLSAGSTKAYGGTGLGLALVRSLAQAQGGEVLVRSTPGQGAVFTLTLPQTMTPLEATALAH